METLNLAAKTRTVKGKQVKQLRATNQVPAVVYGHGLGNKDISVEYGVFVKLLDKAGESTLVDLAIDGGEPVKVLIQEVQREPLSGRATHVDFRQVNMKEKLEADIELNFIGESPAVKESGAIIIKSMDSLTVRCLPQYLVHQIDVDLKALKQIDDVIVVSDITPPEGIEFLAEPNAVIAVASAPMTEEEMKSLEAKPEMDVTAVKTEADEKKAKAAAEAPAEEKEAEKAKEKKK